MRAPSTGPLLAPLTSLKVGGPAREVVHAGTQKAILDALARGQSHGSTPPLVLGEGSNIVISDHGFDGVVIRIEGGRIEATTRADGDAYDFFVDAGVRWDDFVAETVRLGCTGVEMLSGIPGRVGAAPMQNINAYGQQICKVLVTVEVIDRAKLEISEVPEADCGFAFRTSRFKQEWADLYIVSGIRCTLSTEAASPPEPSTYADIVRFFERGGSPIDVADRRNAVLTVRREKSMLLDPADPNARSVGSFFINPLVPDALADTLEARFDALGLRVNYPEGHVTARRTGLRRIPAAHVLRASGFNAGDSWGSIGLSQKHVLALVTRPGATADDVWLVGNYIRERVHESTDVLLEFESRFVGDFTQYDRRRVEADYEYYPAPEGEPDWMTTLRQ